MVHCESGKNDRIGCIDLIGQQGQAVPGLPAPPQAEGPQQPQDFWGAFKAQMDYDPTQAWRIVNQADPRVMANKLFVME